MTPATAPSIDRDDAAAHAPLAATATPAPHAVAAAHAPHAAATPHAPLAADPTPDAFRTARLVRGALQVVALLGALVLVAVFAPGLGDVRQLLARASFGWVAAAVALQLLSCVSYVLMFRPVFCAGRSWGTANRIGWSALGMGSIVPASGAAGLALGGWALMQDGMEPERVARRSVAFFLIKSSVNFVAVALLGTAMALGVVGPHVSPWLTAFPAALATLAIVAVLLLPRLGDDRATAAATQADERSALASETPSNASRTRHALTVARRTLVTGTRDAIEIVRTGNPLVFAGAFGYWIFDNAVLWAAFHAFGAHVSIWVILLGYLVGQLGGALPIPGGVGGIDLGLIGMLIAFGAPAAATAAAVLTYRVILFWLPLLGGTIGFVALRRSLARPRRERGGAAAGERADRGQLVGVLHA